MSALLAMDPPPTDARWIVHAADAFVVVDKPSGLLSVPGRGDDKQDCAHARLVAQGFGDALVVHRLDMSTSGLMVFARGLAAQRALSRAFAAREVEKRYEAWVADDGATVEQAPADDAGWHTIDAPIAADWPRRPLRIVDPEHGAASRTRWRLLARGHVGTLTAWRVELSPETGRTHQLRVHMAHVGLPILGDALYAPPAVQRAAPRLLLHARSLAFAHPNSGDALRFERPAPF